MKKFILKISIFSLPLIILIGIPCYVLFISGENLQFLRFGKSKGKLLIGYAYSEDNYRSIKWEKINSNPDYRVIAVGSSRVLQFRDKMFTTSFYNAGFAVSSVNDFLPFLKSIDSMKYPDYLIIGLDQWMFNNNWDNLKTKRNSEYWIRANTMFDGSDLKKIWIDLFNNKYSLRLPTYNDSISRLGLNAYVNNKGIRNDGSMQYGDQIDKLLRDDFRASDYHFSDTYKRIKEGNRRFEYSSVYNKDAETALSEFLAFCQLHKIKVVAILPPFSDDVYNTMVSSGDYNYLNYIYPNLKVLFDLYDFEIYDFSLASSVNSNNDELLDGFHGGEVTYQKALINMLESNSVLNNVTDVGRLKDELNSRINRYVVYSY